MEQIAAEQHAVHAVVAGHFEDLLEGDERVLLPHGIRFHVSEMVVRGDHDAQDVSFARCPVIGTHLAFGLPASGTPRFLLEVRRVWRTREGYDVAAVKGRGVWRSRRAWCASS